jgi:hypothetical protein
MNGISNTEIIKLSKGSTRPSTATKENGDEFMEYFLTSQSRAAL